MIRGRTLRSAACSWERKRTTAASLLRSADVRLLPDLAPVIPIDRVKEAA
jgi:hypothetical protein